MATPSRLPPIQEMPPKGGYPMLDFSRKKGTPRISGAGLFGAVTLVVCYGYYQVIQGNIERRQLKEERRERRAAILPFLQAEEDIRYLREYSKYLDEEKRVMKGVAGWEVGKSVYSTEKWVPKAGNYF